MSIQRVHNFNPGPGALPLSVLEEAARDLVCHPDSGMSIMEMSHRSDEWIARQDALTASLRRVLGVPEDMDILYLQGGASLQFAMVPLNLLAKGEAADFVVTGTWAVNAVKEARKVGRVAFEAASSAATGFDRIPEGLSLNAESRYLHYTSNNTIFGTAFSAPPDGGGKPLVCDASSDILSKPFDFGGHDLVYAGAQKNMGPAGVTIVFVRRGLLGRVGADVPTMLAYKTHAEKDSAYNTPPVWSMYIVGLVLGWVEAQGGLEAIEALNKAKAALIYDAIDASGGFFVGTVQRGSRSRMNVTFRLGSEELEELFLSEAGEAGFAGLRGHRSVGGCRASLYNALPMESARALVDFMGDFRRRRG